jgi:hypothetical protein
LGIPVPAPAWIRAASHPGGAVRLVPNGIVQETHFVIGDGTLADIDRALCRFFSLPE